MRILAYNVRSLRDDAAAVAEVIRGLEPDVVCIQEAPRFLRWRSKCAALAREAGLFVVTGGRPAGAMLLLAQLRVRVLGTRDVLLSKSPWLHQRGLAVGVVEVAGDSYTVASMHLGLDAQERIRHVEEIFTQLDQYDAPLVVAGDVNETPGEPAWAALCTHLVDAFAAAGIGAGDTYSAANPHKRIDGVFVDPRLEVVSCEVPEIAGREAASDHLPVLAVLRSR
jgi:endonuclease/exonuclease/phosphatase family metal-dependent hydrolase